MSEDAASASVSPRKCGRGSNASDSAVAAKATASMKRATPPEMAEVTPPPPDRNVAAAAVAVVAFHRAHAHPQYRTFQIQTSSLPHLHLPKSRPLPLPLLPPPLVSLPRQVVLVPGGAD